MINIIQQNFVALLPILMLSLAGTAIVLERLFYFFTIREDANLTRRAGALYTQAKYEAALETLSSDSSPESAILRYAINNRFVLDDLLRSRMEIIARNRISLMEKRVAFLATLANVATLFGLLGTVIGMIIAFSSMNQARASDPYILAGGISQALVTTAAGLITAIPALMFYHWFAETIARRAERFESLIAEILSAKGARL